MSGRVLMSRRGLLDLGLGLGVAPWLKAAPEYLNRFPRMVHDHFLKQVRLAQAESLHQKQAMRTREDAQRWVDTARKKVRLAFGAFPDRTPLKPVVTGTLERDAYKIEKVIFESRPRFPVTANLYLPKGRPFPLPGVVGTCGHSAEGKGGETYQAFAQGLARLGYVVLIFDPIGQGERLQYVDDNLNPVMGTGVREHLHAGNQQFLVGEFFGSWRAWDGLRALDYLLTRKEVDPRHVGITGNSGGGTMTTWLAGLDDRWTMAAPSCFVTTFQRNLENELPADTEQCPPRALALGLDHDDFLAAFAPRPLILLAKEKDYFDVRGNQEAFERLRRLYRLLGAEDRLVRFVGPTYHGFTQENREAMYGWFNRWTRVSDQNTEPKLEMEEQRDLWCTPNGQVAELRPKTVVSFTREKAGELARKRKNLNGKDLEQAVRAELRLPEEDANAPDYRILRPLSDRRYPKKHALPYAVETQDGVFALVYRLSEEPHYSRPPRDGGPAVLYIAHHSSDRELREEPLVQDLLTEAPGATFYACDVRGTGESQPDTCAPDSFHQPYGNDYFYAIHSFMLDKPYVGQKTWDILRVLDFLTANGHQEIHLAALGWGTIPATFAAVLGPAVKRVTLKRALTSYQDLATAEMYQWPLSAMLPGVLERFDLPDCYRALEAKQLRQIQPAGPAL